MSSGHSPFFFAMIESVSEWPFLSLFFPSLLRSAARTQDFRLACCWRDAVSLLFSSVLISNHVGFSAASLTRPLTRPLSSSPFASGMSRRMGHIPPFFFFFFFSAQPGHCLPRLNDVLRLLVPSSLSFFFSLSSEIGRGPFFPSSAGPSPFSSSGHRWRDIVDGLFPLFFPDTIEKINANDFSSPLLPPFLFPSSWNVFVSLPSLMTRVL